MNYVRQQVEHYGLAERSVLEVGSYDVNGSVRSLFRGKYLGIDQVGGPGVDMVLNAEKLTGFKWRFGVVVCTEVLEHCERPWLVVEQMARVLDVDGYLILTCRAYDARGAQIDPGAHYGDYWRTSKAGLTLLFEDQGLTVLDCIEDPDSPGLLSVAHVQ